MISSERAVVVLISELKITQVTNSDGNFVFESVPAGSYTLIFTLGDNNLARQAIVTAGKTNELEQIVDIDGNMVLAGNTLYVATPEAADKQCTHLTHQDSRDSFDGLIAALNRSAAQTAAT